MTEFKRVTAYAMKFKWWFVLGVVLTVLTVALQLLSPVVLMVVLDRYIDIDGPIDLSPVLMMLALFFLIRLIHAVAAYFSHIVLQNTGAKTVQELRTDVFRHVQKLPVKYFDNLPAGMVVARITNDTESILALFSSVIPTFLVSILTIVGITGAIYFVSPFAGMVMLAFIPVIILWIIIYRVYVNKHNHVKRERNSDMNAMINESINGMPIIQVYNQEQKIAGEFKQLNDQYTKSAMKIVNADSLTGDNLVDSMRSIVFAILIYIFASTFLSGEMALTVGAMYLLVDYVSRFFNPLLDIVSQLNVLEQARVASVKVFELLDENSEKEDSGRLQNFNGNIQFKNVNFSYDGENKVLKNINIDVSNGDTVALVGHTGSGKSSIINLLMRFYDPDEGEILFDGENTRMINKQNLRSVMSIVLQDPFIYSGTLFYNIRLNNEEISKEDAEKALISVGGAPMLERMQDGLYTVLTERGATLSLGERQLISFARALAFKPKVLILDEATSNIDSETEQMIQHAMKVVSKDRTTFIIAHRLSTIQHSENIIMLSQGRIVEEGSHRELMELNGGYAEMYRMQVTKH